MAAAATLASLTFHTGVPDALDYVCRLCRKAVARGAQVVVRAREDHLRRLDEALWTFEHEGFLPHVVIRPEDAAQPSPLHRRTPIWLSGESFPAVLEHAADRVVVNLGPGAAVEGLEGAAWTGTRLIEVVAQDAASREEGQRRWRLYRDLGWKAEHLPYGTTGAARAPAEPGAAQ